MDFYFYLVIYLVTSMFYIALKTSLKERLENLLKYKMFVTYPIILSIVKAIPLVLAMMFAFLLKTEKSALYLGIEAGLLFCLLGDFFIDRSLIQGMLMFSLAHIFFIFTFIYGISLHFSNFLANDFIVLSTLTILIIGYDYAFSRYLLLLHIPDRYNVPIIIYMILISLMLTISIWLAYIVAIGPVILLPLGALLFVVSDSLIAVREFSGKVMDRSVIKIMGTYYIAIFFISLTTMFL